MVDELQEGHVGVIGIAPGFEAIRKTYQHLFVNKTLLYRFLQALPVYDYQFFATLINLNNVQIECAFVCLFARSNRVVFLL